MMKSRLIYDYKPFNTRKMIRFYEPFIKPCDLCFDVGSHTGNRTDSWLRMGARVVAFEPQPAFTRLLEKKFKNRLNFNLEKCALGDHPGQSRLFISRLNPAISTISVQWQEIMKSFDSALKWEDEGTTPVHTLDEMIEKYGKPDFCKIDVEGYELEVLNGLTVPLEALSFELFPTTPARSAACIQRLEKLGPYEYNWSLIESFRFVSARWLTAQQMTDAIEAYKGRKSGDIYARLISA